MDFSRTAYTMGLASALLMGCASSSTVRRFPLQAPFWTDTDMQSVNMPCHPDPKKPGHQVCTPKTYESSFAWDAGDNLIFRPMSRFFAVDPGGEAVNVNSMDEVPDSSWFVNRIGRRAMSAKELMQGFCGEQSLDPNAPDGSWEIDEGKANGANPGFRIRDEKGVRYMLKSDPPEQPERATGATAIAARVYYAAGWWAPCDSVVYFDPKILRLKPGLTITDNTGTTRPLDRPELMKMLTNASRRDGKIRMVASRWLPGRTIGPFRYEGTRADDPNDVIPHQDRRDLRGARIVAAWLNHFDSREQNSMDTWMSADPKDKDATPGHMRHWYMDLGDCFGSEWQWDGISKRLGHAYYLDFSYLVEDFATLGLVERPWDRAKKSPDGSIFGYFHSRDFDAEKWRGGYPNPAFQRMTERDGAWAARIVARFTDELVDAAVRVGDYTDPRHVAFLSHHLKVRRDKILQRYLSKLSPITDVELTGKESLCGVDLGRKTGVFGGASFAYQAKVYGGSGAKLVQEPVVQAGPGGKICLNLMHHAQDGGAQDGAEDRYTVIALTNGQSKGPLWVHLYDLGPTRGYRLVGIERPDSWVEPRW